MSFQIRLGTTKAIAKNGSGTEGTTMITVPISSTYKTTSTTLVKSGRNASGILITTVVKAGLRKVEMSWRVMSSSDYANLGKFFNAHFIFYGYFFDQDTNTWQTLQFYVGDRVADALKNEQWTQGTNVGGDIAPKHVENLKLSFIDTGVEVVS